MLPEVWLDKGALVAYNGRTMRIKDLIEQLQKEDPNRRVIMQRDPEGNGYSPLAKIWRGGFKDYEWTGDDKAGKNIERVLFLQPEG